MNGRLVRAGLVVVGALLLASLPTLLVVHVTMADQANQALLDEYILFQWRLPAGAFAAGLLGYALFVLLHVAPGALAFGSPRFRKAGAFAAGALVVAAFVLGGARPVLASLAFLAATLVPEELTLPFWRARGTGA